MRPISEGFFGGKLISNASCKRVHTFPDSLSDFTKYIEQGLEHAKKSTLERTPKQDEFWNEFVDPSMFPKNEKMDNSDYFLDQPEF